MNRIIIAAIAMAAAAPAVAEDQFDLVCRGESVTVRYRIDLQKAEWCRDDCKQRSAISSVTSGLITLVSKDRQFRNDTEALTQIDRVTGEWTDISVGGGMEPVNRAGKCESAAFSGFPAAKF